MVIIIRRGGLLTFITELHNVSRQIVIIFNNNSPVILYRSHAETPYKRQFALILLR